MKITNLEHLENVSQQSQEIDLVTGGIRFSFFAFAEADAKGPSYYPQVAGTTTSATATVVSWR